MDIRRRVQFHLTPASIRKPRSNWERGRALLSKLYVHVYVRMCMHQLPTMHKALISSIPRKGARPKKAWGGWSWEAWQNDGSGPGNELRAHIMHAHTDSSKL